MLAVVGLAGNEREGEGVDKGEGKEEPVMRCALSHWLWVSWLWVLGVVVIVTGIVAGAAVGSTVTGGITGVAVVAASGEATISSTAYRLPLVGCKHGVPKPLPSSRPNPSGLTLNSRTSTGISPQKRLELTSKYETSLDK